MPGRKVAPDMTPDISGDLAHKRETDLIREVMDARIGAVWTTIDGIKSILERVTVSVEKQAEQNTNLALMGNTLAHFQETFVEHRAETDARFSALNAAVAANSKRLDEHDKVMAVKSITRTGLMTALVAGVTASGVFVTQHFDKIAALAATAFGG